VVCLLLDRLSTSRRPGPDSFTNNTTLLFLPSSPYNTHTHTHTHTHARTDARPHAYDNLPHLVCPSRRPLRVSGGLSLLCFRFVGARHLAHVASFVSYLDDSERRFSLRLPEKLSANTVQRDTYPPTYLPLSLTRPHTYTYTPDPRSHALPLSLLFSLGPTRRRSTSTSTGS